ncbi:MAG: large subunit ribosomal protein L23 [Gammaproteobacteria bacterium]|jgi:large subunit ribosomal protein L23
MNMSEERLFQIVRRPHISEKTAGIAESKRQITFEVLKTATKPEVKAAIETLFKVEVETVKTMVVKGKTKRSGRFLGSRNDWKKAYVTLKEGHDIDFIGMAS